MLRGLAVELSELKDRIITSFNGTEDDLNEVLELVSITFKEKAFLKSYTKTVDNIQQGS